MKKLNVSGVSYISVEADLVNINFQLEYSSKIYDEAIQGLNQLASRLKALLLELSFEEKDLKTRNFRVRQNFKFKKADQSRVFDSYFVSQNIKIEFDMNAKRLSKLVLSISENMENLNFNIHFSLKNKSQYQNELIKIAVKDAKEKASQIADAAGVKLGDIIEMNYSKNNIAQFRSNNLAYSAKSAGPEIEPMEIKLNDQIECIFEIN